MKQVHVAASPDPAVVRHALVLVVGDDDTRTIYSALLRHNGFDVDVAADCLEAVSAIRLRRPDLILLGLWRRATCEDLCRELNTDAASDPVPIVALSFAPIADQIDRVRKLGCVSVLVKPAHVDEVLAAIDQVLARSHGIDPAPAVTRPASDRLSSEQKLQRSEALRSAILDASLDAIVSMDHRGVITEFNTAAEQIFGLQRQDAVGRAMSEVIIPAHLREAHRRGLERYLSTGEPHVIGRRIEIDAMRSDGSIFPVELAITVLPGVAPPTFTGFLRDITERRRADEDLRRANAELQARAAEERALRAVAEGLTAAVQVSEIMREVAEGSLVASGAVGAFVEQVVTPSADVEVVSAVGERVPPVGTRVAYPGSLTEEIIERRESVFLVRMEGLGVAMAPYLADHCAGCSVLVVPLLVEREVFGALVLLREADDPPFEHGVVNRARTLGDLASLALQRVTVLAENENRRAVAEGAVRSRDEVLSIVSHDLRTPLSTVVMAAGLLADEELSLSEAERRQQLSMIKRAGERMNRLIQDLLDVTRMEGGRFTVHCRCEDPTALAAEACDSFRPIAALKSQTLDCEAAAGLPRVYADRDRVLELLTNYLGNASKFTPEGGRLAVRVKSDVTGGVSFAVADTGPGIASEDVEHLFDRFWQARKTAHLGAGLGLAIAKGIAQAHGGSVWAESEPGKGSTFYFLLPDSPRCA